MTKEPSYSKYTAFASARVSSIRDMSIARKEDYAI